jgi:hypothetical protein
MKLSDYKGEKALDVLANMLEPATEILADNEVANGIKRGDIPVKIVKVAIQRHKRAVIELLAALNDMPPDEYAEQVSLLTLPKQLLELMNDEDVQSLFSSRGQMTEAQFSGSAMESTGAGGK